jgi:hypothetical protein
MQLTAKTPRAQRIKTLRSLRLCAFAVKNSNPKKERPRYFTTSLLHCFTASLLHFYTCKEVYAINRKDAKSAKN